MFEVHLDLMRCSMADRSVCGNPTTRFTRLGGLLLQQYMCRAASQHRCLFRIRLRHSDFHRSEFSPFPRNRSRSDCHLQSQLGQLKKCITERRTSKTPIQARPGHSKATFSRCDHRFPVLVSYMHHGTDGSMWSQDSKFCLRLVCCRCFAREFSHQSFSIYPEISGQ